MNTHRLFKITILAIVVLLAISAAVPWRSLAAQPVQESVRLRDSVRMAAPAPVAPVPCGPGFQMVNAFQFRTAPPDLLGNFYNDELINPGTLDNFYQAALTLPNNITITGMVVYFCDNNSEKDYCAAIWRFDPSTGNHLALAELCSSGAQDLYRNLIDTSIVEPVIDQQNYSYYVEVGMPPVGSTLRVAAVRIDYAYTAQLPLVTRNH